MEPTFKLQSPAKLNLMLNITGRRNDGYHKLQTVFQFIGLYDELSFTVTDDAAVRRVHTESEIASADDLVVRAAQLLKQELSISAGVDISIKKSIPIGGGLGGGSSNAATALMALNRLWKLGLSKLYLQQIGRKLGADVPIFIHGESAWAEGVGDKFTTLKLAEPWYLIINPRVFVSTAQIFASKDLTRDCHPLTIRAFQQGEGENVCQPLVCALYPEIQEAIDWLNNFSPVRMTGTGGCLFAVFDSFEKANEVNALRPEKWSGYVARGMNTNPVTSTCFI